MSHNPYSTGYMPETNPEQKIFRRSGRFVGSGLSYADGPAICMGRSDKPVPFRGRLVVGDLRENMQSMDHQRQ